VIVKRQGWEPLPLEPLPPPAPRAPGPAAGLLPPSRPQALGAINPSSRQPAPPANEADFGRTSGRLLQLPPRAQSTDPLAPGNGSKGAGGRCAPPPSRGKMAPAPPPSRGGLFASLPRRDLCVKHFPAGAQPLYTLPRAHAPASPPGPGAGRTGAGRATPVLRGRDALQLVVLAGHDWSDTTALTGRGRVSAGACYSSRARARRKEPACTLRPRPPRLPR
jgi:hypothetical protein